MDTGVNTAYLSPPPAAPLGALGGCQEARSDRCAPPGTKVTVAVPNAANPIASYSFIVGEDGNPMQPGDVVVVHDPAPFLNTSRHFLSGMNFIYDAAGGYVGFQWTLVSWFCLLHQPLPLSVMARRSPAIDVPARGFDVSAGSTPVEAGTGPAPRQVRVRRRSHVLG
jgi:hypothetical protein